MKKLMIVPILFMAICLQGSYVGEPLNPLFNSKTHNSRALWYAKWKHYYPAIEEYKMAIGLNPESGASAAYYSNLGQIYQELGRPDWTITCVENAIKLNPICMYYYERLVDAYESAKKLDEKEKVLLDATKNDFENSYNWLILGLIQDKKNDYKGAKKSYNNYILLEPKIVLLSAVKNKLNEVRKKELLNKEQL